MSLLKLGKNLFLNPIILILALCLIFSTSIQTEEVNELLVDEGCTSIIVGKQASLDGSTMTSHSCDSNTDRTWINIVPHQKYKSGEMSKLYFEAKRTTGPDDPDRLDRGEIPQVLETYAYINKA